MKRAIKILPRARTADCSAFKDEKRDRQQRDRRHFLVDVLRNRIHRRRRHECDHENRRHGAEGERDRHAGKHDQQRGAAIEKPDRQDAHAGFFFQRAMWLATCRRSWKLSRTMPQVINEYGIHSGGCHVEPVRYPSTMASSSNSQDFQAKKAQKTSDATSTRSNRMPFALGVIILESTSMAT